MPYGRPLVPYDRLSIPAQDINIPQEPNEELALETGARARVRPRAGAPVIGATDASEFDLGTLADIVGGAQTTGDGTSVRVPGVVYQKTPTPTPTAPEGPPNATERQALELAKRGLGVVRNLLPGGGTPVAAPRNPATEPAYQAQRAGERADYSGVASGNLPDISQFSAPGTPYSFGLGGITAPDIGRALVTPQLGASLPGTPAASGLSFGADLGLYDIPDFALSLPDFAAPGLPEYNLGVDTSFAPSGMGGGGADIAGQLSSSLPSITRAFTPYSDVAGVVSNLASGTLPATLTESIPYVGAAVHVAQQVADLVQNALGDMPAGQQAAHAVLGSIPLFGGALTSLVDQLAFGGGDYVPKRQTEAAGLEKATAQAPWLLSAASTPEEIAAAIQEISQISPIGQYASGGPVSFSPEMLTDPSAIALNFTGTHFGAPEADTALTNMVRRQAYLAQVNQQLAPVAAQAGVSVPALLRQGGQESLAAALENVAAQKARVAEARQAQQALMAAIDPFNQEPADVVSLLDSASPEVRAYLLRINPWLTQEMTNREQATAAPPPLTQREERLG